MRSRRHKEPNVNLRTEKYNKQNKKLNGWAQKQNGWDRGNSELENRIIETT